MSGVIVEALSSEGAPRSSAISALLVGFAVILAIVAVVLVAAVRGRRGAPSAAG